jgi:hypothetical protein
MLKDFFESVRDGLRHRFGRRHTDTAEKPNEDEFEALRRHNDAEARVTGRTIGDPNSVRAFGKGRPR